MWLAIAHIIGSLLTGFVLGAIALFMDARVSKKSSSAELQAISTQLGITIEDLETPENFDRAVLLMASRFSNERLGNRFSDLCGWLQDALDWLVLLAQIGIFVGAVWIAVTGSPREADIAWFIPVISVFFWIERILFRWLCRLLTGRYPGQARKSRKRLGEILKTRKQQTAQPYMEYLGQD